MTKKEQVLSMLEAAGPEGVTNRQFTEAGIYRYSARIKEIRDEGTDVDTIRIRGGYFKFRLASPPCGPVEGATGVVADTSHPRVEDSPGSAKPSGDPPPSLFVCDLNDSPYY
jgi:hypothetical protein